MLKSVLLISLSVSLLFQPDSKRRVLLFSTGSTNSQLLRQQNILAEGSQELLERDIVIETYILNEHNRKVFKKYKALDRPFLFVLIGKDGGEKLRSSSPVATQSLFGLIDQMPMRQGEMRRQ